MVLHKLVPHFVDYFYALSPLPNQAENTEQRRRSDRSWSATPSAKADKRFGFCNFQDIERLVSAGMKTCAKKQPSSGLYHVKPLKGQGC